VRARRAPAARPRQNATHHASNTTASCQSLKLHLRAAAARRCCRTGTRRRAARRRTRGSAHAYRRAGDHGGARSSRSNTDRIAVCPAARGSGSRCTCRHRCAACARLGPPLTRRASWQTAPQRPTARFARRFRHEREQEQRPDCSRTLGTFGARAHRNAPRARRLSGRIARQRLRNPDRGE
jgi:hypothetical protein